MGNLGQKHSFSVLGPHNLYLLLSRMQNLPLLLHFSEVRATEGVDITLLSDILLFLLKELEPRVAGNRKK